MSDFTTIKATINAEIKTNGVQAITALVLNPILLGMITATEDCIGDLTDLPTSDQSNIVAAIGELWNLYQEIVAADPNSDFLGVFDSYDDLVAEHPTGTAGQFAIVLENGSDQEGIYEYEWSEDLEQWVEVVGSGSGDVQMLVIGSDVNGYRSLKFYYELLDFVVEETDNGGISITLADKYKTHDDTTISIQAAQAITVLLDSTAGRYYDADLSLQLSQDHEFEYDQEILGGLARMPFKVKADATGFPVVNHANDIAGKSDIFEPGQPYMLNVQCIYADPVAPANNIVVYWFEKMERAMFMPIMFAISDEETDVVDSQSIKKIMPFKYRLREVRVTFHKDDYPQGSDMDYDFKLEGTTVYSTGPEVDNGTSDSRDSVTTPVFSNGLDYVIIEDGQEWEVILGTVGTTNAGTGCTVCLYGWLIEDIIDASSVTPQSDSN